jgi:hypothetical protein
VCTCINTTNRFFEISSNVIASIYCVCVCVFVFEHKGKVKIIPLSSHSDSSWGQVSHFQLVQPNIPRDENSWKTKFIACLNLTTRLRLRGVLPSVLRTFSWRSD